MACVITASQDRKFSNLKNSMDNINIGLPLTLKKIYEERLATDLDGNVLKLHSEISEGEALILMKMVEVANAKVTLETGLAFGVSALAICHASRSLNGNDWMHYGVDPNQLTEYRGTALASLKKEGLDNNFTLLEGPSHLMLPKLIEQGVVLDCAFIDGWHTFDYTLADFFLIDKMLKPGGYLAFHDMYALSKQKVLRFILSHRKYQVAKELKVKGNESLKTTIKFFLWRLYKYPYLFFSWFHWNYQLFNSSGLIVLKKLENFEPDFSFYKNF